MIPSVPWRWTGNPRRRREPFSDRPSSVDVDGERYEDNPRDHRRRSPDGASRILPIRNCRSQLSYDSVVRHRAKTVLAIEGWSWMYRSIDMERSLALLHSWWLGGIFQRHEQRRTRNISPEASTKQRSVNSLLTIRPLQVHFTVSTRPYPSLPTPLHSPPYTRYRMNHTTAATTPATTIGHRSLLRYRFPAGGLYAVTGQNSA